MNNPFIHADCPDCKRLTGGCGNHGSVITPEPMSPFTPAFTPPPPMTPEERIAMLEARVFALEGLCERAGLWKNVPMGGFSK